MFKTGLKRICGKTFKEMWERFTYSGATAKEQAVYFFNTPKFVLYGMGFFNVVHSDLLFDAALLSGIGCTIIFILTIKSFKVKK